MKNKMIIASLVISNIIAAVMLSINKEKRADVYVKYAIISFIIVYIALMYLVPVNIDYVLDTGKPPF